MKYEALHMPPYLQEERQWHHSADLPRVGRACMHPADVQTTFRRHRGLSHENCELPELEFS
jgi:hypothetical protein